MFGLFLYFKNSFRLDTHTHTHTHTHAHTHTHTEGERVSKIALENWGNYPCRSVQNFMIRKFALYLPFKFEYTGNELSTNKLLIFGSTLSITVFKYFTRSLYIVTYVRSDVRLHILICFKDQYLWVDVTTCFTFSSRICLL